MTTEQADNHWRKALIAEVAAMFYCEGASPYSLSLDGTMGPLTKDETDAVIAEADKLNERLAVKL
jgi:hypothetical protein